MESGKPILNLFILFSFLVLPYSVKADSHFFQWMQWRKEQSIQKTLSNIAPHGAAPGAVVASPEKNSPPYFFHWVRDAAITMNLVFDLYAEETRVSEKQKYQDLLYNFVEFTERNQKTKTLTGLGEPKFFPDGRAFDEGWCRPQNDGPALRASVLIRFSNALTEKKEHGVLSRKGSLRSALPEVIKADLDYVASQWRNPNCELWEEISGDHFYNRIVQVKALRQGAEFAKNHGDSGSAFWYQTEALKLDHELQKHWRTERGLFLPSMNVIGDDKGKNSGLDSAVILAALHSGFDGEFVLEPTDSKILSNFHLLVQAFQQLYPINRVGFPGVAVGRYPEDIYGGTHFDRGNPWVLITAAFANFSYQNAKAAQRLDRQEESQAWLAKGDAFLKRIQIHGNPDGSLSEQIDAETGYMISARDLTWSHVEVLQALRARQQVLRRSAKSL